MTGATGYCFAADLGGTKLAAAIADADGKIIADLTEPTDPRGAASVATQLVACAGKLATSAQVDASRVRQVMVGVPGAVEPRTGRISLIPNIAGLDSFDLLGFLRGHFGPRVAIENDVNLAMLGEHALGCARHCRNAAFLALGTGTGLGLLLDGAIFRGAHGAAGEIADLPMGRDPVVRPASVASTFEREVGSIAILDRYRRQGGTDVDSVREIFRLLGAGDQVAATVLDATALAVAIGVVMLQSLLDLELVVFGGSIGVRPELHQRVARILPTLFARSISITPSQLGDRAGIVGAAWAAANTVR